MNDKELDQLLDAWKAPEAPASLRNGLHERFPRAERRRFVRPLKWAMAAAAGVLLIVLASGTVAVAMDDNGEKPFINRFHAGIHDLMEHVMNGLDMHRASFLTTQFRESDPKVYVDGKLIAPPVYTHAGSMDITIPGEGTYGVSFYSLENSGWKATGTIHGSVVEFQAGSKNVRIECNRSIVDQRKVFVKRRDRQN